MCKYSVIVPVYKVETLLSRCIESILNQTVTDFELILVDDGSPDRSGEICDEYAARDPRIRVIHQENGGVSRARNAGLDIARGKYIVFVDSDDWVNSTFLDLFNQDDDDLIISCFSVFLNDGTIKEITYEENKTVVISSEEDMIAFLKKWYAIQVTGKRFKRTLIDDHCLRFDSLFHYGEDSIFVAQYLLHTHTIKTKSSLTYNICRVKEDSLTELANKKWFLNYSSLQEHLYYIFCKYPKVQTFLAQKYLWILENEIHKYIQTPTKKRKAELIRVLKAQHLSTCVKRCSSDLPLVTKIVLMLKIPALVFLRYKSTSK